MKTFLFFTAFFVLNFSMAPEIKAQYKEKAQDFIFLKANTIVIDTVLSSNEICEYLIKNGFVIDHTDQTTGKVTTKQFNLYKHGTNTGYMEIQPEKDCLLITGYALATFGNSEYKMKYRTGPNIEGKVFNKINEFAVKMAKDYGVKVGYLKL